MNKNRKYAFITIIYVLLNMFLLCFSNYYLIKGENPDNSKYLLYFLILFVIIFGITFITFRIIKSNSIKLEKKWLFIALILSSGYLIMSPVFSQSDESHHFIRAYQITKGSYISPKNEFGYAHDKIPECVINTIWDDNDRFSEYKQYSDIEKEIKIKCDSNKYIERNVNASNYIFINYIPQSLGIFIGKTLNTSPYIMGFLGRMLNMITCILLLYLAIKTIPVHKKFFMILFLSPTILSYVASLSADGLLISMCALLVAYVIKLIYRKEKMKCRDIIILILLILFVSTCKVCYLPIIGIILLIPSERYGSKKEAIISKIIMITLGISLSLIWFFIASIQISNNSAEITGIIKYIKFFPTFINSFMRNGLNYIENIFAGSYLYQERVTPFWYIPLTYIYMIYIIIKNSEDEIKLDKILKYIVYIIALTVTILIAFALYMAQGNNSILISGIQGRYFMPILLLLPLVIKKAKTAKEININKYIFISILLNITVYFNMINIFIK